jgi:hypothetical protein
MNECRADICLHILLNLCLTVYIIAVDTINMPNIPKQRIKTNVNSSFVILYHFSGLV